MIDGGRVCREGHHAVPEDNLKVAYCLYALACIAFVVFTLSRSVVTFHSNSNGKLYANQSVLVQYSESSTRKVMSANINRQMACIYRSGVDAFVVVMNFKIHDVVRARYALGLLGRALDKLSLIVALIV